MVIVRVSIELSVVVVVRVILGMSIEAVIFVSRHLGGVELLWLVSVGNVLFKVGVSILVVRVR